MPQKSAYSALNLPKIYGPPFPDPELSQTARAMGEITGIQTGGATKTICRVYLLHNGSFLTDWTNPSDIPDVSVRRTAEKLKFDMMLSFPSHHTMAYPGGSNPTQDEDLASICSLKANNSECAILDIIPTKHAELMATGMFDGDESMIRLRKTVPYCVTIFYKQRPPRHIEIPPTGYKAFPTDTLDGAIVRTVIECLETRFHVACP